ncbi:MAG: type II secretion system GspH family protein [Candidatus Omnitrophica bacterium]|nr:type II secretion system GspH family protein [Candidatus Omnitrophota bacterium]
MLAKKKAVTLIELLIAMGILALLSVILFSVFNVSLRAWKKADNIFKANTIARVVLDRMSREISSAIIVNGSNDFYCLGIDSTSSDKLRTNSIGDEFYFIAALNPNLDNDRSDLCEVGFWLDGQNAADYELMRFYVTDDRVSGPPVDFNFNFSSGASNQLSDNITDLQITYYDDNGIAKNSWGAVNSSGVPITTDGVPSKIEISITVQIGMGTQATNPEFYQNTYTATISFLQ